MNRHPCGLGKVVFAWALLTPAALGCGREAPPPDHADRADHAHHGEPPGRAASAATPADGGTVELTAHAIELAGIGVGTAQPRRLDVTFQSPGEVRLNGERVLQVRPRFPGVVQQLGPRLGDTVRNGDLLAVIHSNESFTDYPIQASMGGTVVSRDVAVGAAVDHESVLFTIADLATVWVDFAIYPQHVGRVHRGQPVRVLAAAEGAPPAPGKVDYVGPLLEQDTRVSYGRVILGNAQQRWQPGLYVTVEVTVDRADVPVAVPESALVRTAEGPAVFRAAGRRFALQHVGSGRSDGAWTEVTRGLAAGDSIVVANAFLLKAELGKSTAGHDH